MSQRNTITVLPGDGIGPEVTAAAARILASVAPDLELREAAIGGAAMDLTGDPLPPDTLEQCRASDAILLGAVGGPKWSDPQAPVRPEQGLLRLRSVLGLYVNLRPVPVFPEMAGQAPLRPELLRGVDLLFVRELTGGIYFGPRREHGEGATDREKNSAQDTMLYSVPEIERVAHAAFRAAQGRGNKVTSVDKANVLASMRLWRSTVEQVAKQYPDVALEHCLVDACAMHLLTRPATFDVILAGNLFGDILSDEAAVLAGSLGLLPSASLGDHSPGLFEPCHGSAPDIAGQGIANPLGAILSAALLLRHGLGREDNARRVEAAVAAAIAAGHRSADMGAAEGQAITSEAMTNAVLAEL